MIDSGKSVAAGMYMDDIWKAYEGEELITKAKPLFTVLTISATGTEMNPHAVLTNEEEKKKWNISNHALYPQVSTLQGQAVPPLPPPRFFQRSP